MTTITQAASKNQNAEFIRILMPLLVIILLVLVIKSFFGNIFGGIGSIAESLNIKNTAEENAAIIKTNQQIQSLNNSSSNPFDAGYFQKGINTAPLTGAKALQLAYLLHGAVGTFYDTPTDAIGAIKQCLNKAQVSQVAYQFFNAYQTDMFNWLSIHFDTPEQKLAMSIIITYVNNLPTGIK